MIAYIEGQIIEKNPAYVIIDSGGIGYMINISLFTYSRIPDSGNVKLFTHLFIKEDAHVLYGFTTENERELFRELISVSGVGPNTARMILSSYAPVEIKNAIIENNPDLLKSVKGIGNKTAHRIVVDLRDHFKKEPLTKEEFLSTPNNTALNEALSALVMLGFAKNAAQKALDKIAGSGKGQNLSAEALVKEALKKL